MILELDKVLPDPVLIKDCMLGSLSDYKYLGVVMDDKLNWSEHIA